ncbi:hypothetical protein NDU88_005788 [Pleurodeles waltl]|uniref:Uncharacterized protein n=1 Tax=Pleurodeles waltl TaxID=8319 RepID=A0AAV7MB12_PLEWA|nr:hypothetical protein NDU88_005788 [Pleurodeles waltl]
MYADELGPTFDIADWGSRVSRNIDAGWNGCRILPRPGGGAACQWRSVRDRAGSKIIRTRLRVETDSHLFFSCPPARDSERN